MSTIIPVYNRPLLLREAVTSVLAQTYRPLEILIVDDGSTDDTPVMCETLGRESSLVRVLRIPHQGRAGLVREAGRLAAAGEFIQYLDSDDLLMPRKFELMVAALEAHNEADIAYCSTRRYTIGDPPLDAATERTGETFRQISTDFLTRRFWHTSTPLYRRRICDLAGPWSDLMFWEDIEYDLRMAVMGAPLHHCPEFLTDFRDHSLGRLSRSIIHEDPILLAEAVRGYQMIHRHVKRWGIAANCDPVLHLIEDLRYVAAHCRTLGLDQQRAVCLALIGDLGGRQAADVPETPVLRARIEPLAEALAAHSAQCITLPVKIVNRSTIAFRDGDYLSFRLSYHLLSRDGTVLAWDNPRFRFRKSLQPGHQRVVDLMVVAPKEPGRYLVELDLVCEGLTWFKAAGNQPATVPLEVTTNWSAPAAPTTSSMPRRLAAFARRTVPELRKRTERIHIRWRLGNGIRPLSHAWGTDRGQPIHRYYIEQFLSEFAADIRGHCLEFQDPQYVPRFGGLTVARLDILHIDGSNPRATLVADLTQQNDLPPDRFDAIVCTHVLHLIFDVRRAISELHRILKPSGVLLVAAPSISMRAPQFKEFWRFTPEGLAHLLGEAFGRDAVTIRAYGNSLACAGEIRGLVTHEFTAAELDTHDDRFAVEVCGRAVKH